MLFIRMLMCHGGAMPETTTPPDKQGGVVSKPAMTTASVSDQNVMLQLLM